MARQPTLNEAALGRLGAERLAGLVIGEAKRNAAFRKLVMAALAATRGPAAVAAIIDKRVAGLARAKGFVAWDKVKDFAADLAATLATVTGELAEADPQAALERLLRFLATSAKVLERVDDSSGRVQAVYENAAAALPGVAARLDDAAKAALPDLVLAPALTEEHGFLSSVLPELIAGLPAAAVDLFDKRLAAAEQALGPARQRDWTSRMNADRIFRLRQAVADARQDVDAFIALETKRAPERPDPLAVAARLLVSGRYSEALDWVRRRDATRLKIMTRADLADGLAPREAADHARPRLEIEILEAMGDRAAAQTLRWTTFETTLDADLLRAYVARLPDFEDEEALDKAFAHACASKQPYHALAFFLDWPRLDQAARLVLARRGEWDGRNYELLAAAAETLQPDHPTAAVVLYRALLDDILSRARSPAYGHGARYLARLDALAEDVPDAHAAYRAELVKKHGRKAAFWALVKAGK